MDPRKMGNASRNPMVMSTLWVQGIILAFVFGFTVLN